MDFLDENHINTLTPIFKRNGAGVYIKQGESVSPDLLVMLSLAHVIKMVGYHIWSDEKFQKEVKLHPCVFLHYTMYMRAVVKPDPGFQK